LKQHRDLPRPTTRTHEPSSRLDSGKFGPRVHTSVSRQVPACSGISTKGGSLGYVCIRYIDASHKKTRATFAGADAGSNLREVRNVNVGRPYRGPTGSKLPNLRMPRMPPQKDHYPKAQIATDTNAPSGLPIKHFTNRPVGRSGPAKTELPLDLAPRPPNPCGGVNLFSARPGDVPTEFVGDCGAV
jgi:hypothetical protein